MLPSTSASWEPLCDGILAICLIAPLMVMLALASVCTLVSDVNETCVVSALEPFFAFEGVAVHIHCGAG
jgi:hypothetical protein